MTERDIHQTLPAGGLSFRGGFGSLERDQYDVGASYRHAGELVTSRDVRIATDNFADADIVAFFGREGRDAVGFSETPEEVETVYGPDALVTVIARTQLTPATDSGLGGGFGDRMAERGPGTGEPRLADQPWLTIMLVHTDDHAGGFPTDDAGQRVVRAVLGARALPPVEVPRPSRYRGPVGVDGDNKLHRVELGV